MKIVFSPRYDLGLFGLERLHPFDGRKFSRAARVIARHRPTFSGLTICAPAAPLGIAEARLAHSEDYLHRLRDPAFLAQLLEIPLVARIPIRQLWDRVVLLPMRWASAGSLLAAEIALREGACLNLGGGFHHAHDAQTGGFCIYADAAIAVRALRRDGRLARDARVLVIDVDAHQGDGVARAFMNDDRVCLIDIYNGDIFPGDAEAASRIDHPGVLAPGTTGTVYLEVLRDLLREAFADSRSFALAILNCGTDVLENDPLGGLRLTAEAILKRDLLLIDTCRRHAVPWVTLTSGGYTKESADLIAATAIAAATHADARDG